MTNFKKSVLTAAVISAVGMSVVAPVASAVGLADGTYNVYVNTTPTGGSTATFYKPGKDGAWNSTFTFGGPTPSTASNGMTDNSMCVTGSDAVCRGSSIGGDGFAGRWVLSVSGGTISFVSFSEDVITGTAGGNFGQYGTVTGSGTISGTGAISISPTGRMGAIDGNNTLYDKRWNVAPSASTWRELTTGSAFNGVNTINGAAVASLGDVDSDGLPDYSAIFVSGTGVGSDWGPGFVGVPYFETYNVRIEFIAGPVGGEVPIPAAAWLFGSGLIGLATVARRKKKA